MVSKFSSQKRDFSERLAIYEHSSNNPLRETALQFNITIDSVKCIRKHFKKHYESVKEKQSVSAKSYRMRCLKYGHTKGLYGDYLNDFVSLAMLQFSERGLTNAEWAFTEYARATLGRHGQKKEIENAANIEFIIGHQDLKTDEVDEPDVLIEFPKSLDGMFACLVFKWGFTLKEIGDMLGKSEAYLSLKIKPVIEQMRSTYGSEKDT